MIVTFSILDWFWVGAFLLLMIGSGILFYRLGRRSSSDFFLAGRGLPWWLPASSVYATHTATDTPHVDYGSDLSTRASRHLVHLLLGLGCHKFVRFYSNLPEVAGLHTGRMECGPFLGVGVRTTARMDGRLAVLHEHVCPGIGSASPWGRSASSCLAGLPGSA